MRDDVQPSRNSLLAALVEEDRARILPHVETVQLARGVLVGVGEHVSHAYFPIDSVVSLSVTMRDGATAEVATIGREGMDGFVVALGDRHALIRSVVQIEGAAARLPVARLEAAFVASPAIRELFLCYVQALMGQVMQLSACNALHAAEARFCRWLLMLRDRAGTDTLALTHEFLAEMLGVQRPTVSLIARNLQDAGLIRYRRGVVEIVDRAGLEATSCECYRIIRANYDRLLPLSFARRPSGG
jgi:CRP-like cAMP-binding protein